MSINISVFIALLRSAKSHFSQSLGFLSTHGSESAATIAGKIGDYKSRFVSQKRLLSLY